jgi:hypothetical protein
MRFLSVSKGRVLVREFESKRLRGLEADFWTGNTGNFRLRRHRGAIAKMTRADRISG